MNKSSKLVTAAIVVAIALVAAVVIAIPFNGSARALENPGSAADIAAQRIAAAFATIPAASAHEKVEAAAQRAVKGDLGALPCAAQKWPDVSASCLVMTDGSAAPKVRTITIGYQAGEGSSVLVRMPAPQVASR